MAANTRKAGYGAQDIQVLEGLEAVTSVILRRAVCTIWCMKW